MTETKIEYVEDYKVVINPIPRYGPWHLIKGQRPDGYGSKIPTDYMIVLNSDIRKVKRRVYAVCWSNCASFYVIIKGKDLYLRDSDLQDGRDLALVREKREEEE